MLPWFVYFFILYIITGLTEESNLTTLHSRPTPRTKEPINKYKNDNTQQIKCIGDYYNQPDQNTKKQNNLYIHAKYHTISDILTGNIGSINPGRNIIIYRTKKYTNHGNTQYYGELSKTPITNK